MKKLFATTLFTAVLALLLAMSARAAATNDAQVKTSAENDQAHGNGLVLPDNVYDHQPFSFAAKQTVAGEVVSIQTVDGVVVESASTDKYGRVFLAAGLPAGAYLISAAGHEPLGKVAIQQRAGDTLQHSLQSMQLENPPQVLKLSEPWSMNGHGFSPNCADMQANFSASGKNETPLVLAATEDQLKLAAVQQLQPGAAQLRISNQATGQSTAAHDLLLYDIQGNLTRRTMQSGRDETRLVVTVQPENLPLKVKASVVSGPVNFGHGHKDAETLTSNGKASFPVHAEHGTGSFQLAWELVPTAYLLSSGGHSAHVEPAPDKKSEPAGSSREGLVQGLGDSSGSISDLFDRGGFAGDASEKTRNKKDETSPDVPEHTKRCEWRFLRVEKTQYTQDDKQLAEDKAKLAKALLQFINKAAPAAGQVTKAALKGLSISKANNVYLVYILVEIVDGAETVIDTRVVGPLEDKDAMDFWSDSQADDWARQNTIRRNKPTGGCPAR